MLRHQSAVDCHPERTHSAETRDLGHRTFFASRLYSWMYMALSSTSSVSLRKPSSPLLVVHVPLLRTLDPWPNRLWTLALCGKAREMELADGGSRRGTNASWVAS